MLHNSLSSWSKWHMVPHARTMTAQSTQEASSAASMCADASSMHMRSDWAEGDVLNTRCLAVCCCCVWWFAPDLMHTRSHSNPDRTCSALACACSSAACCFCTSASRRERSAVRLRRDSSSAAAACACTYMHSRLNLERPQALSAAAATVQRHNAQKCQARLHLVSCSCMRLHISTRSRPMV
jgi:hypothetical protein